MAGDSNKGFSSTTDNWEGNDPLILPSMDNKPLKSQSAGVYHNGKLHGKTIDWWIFGIDSLLGSQLASTIYELRADDKGIPGLTTKMEH